MKYTDDGPPTLPPERFSKGLRKSSQVDIFRVT